MDIPRQPPSALFSAAKDGDASTYAVSDSQGTSKVYFDELVRPLHSICYTLRSGDHRQIFYSPHPLIPPPMITALTSYHSYLDLHPALLYLDLHPALLYLTWLPSSCPSWLLGLRNSLSISWHSKSPTSHPVECSQDFPVLLATLKIPFLLSPYPL